MPGPSRSCHAWPVPTRRKECVSDRRVGNAYCDSRSPQKEDLDTLAGRGRSLRPLAVWGTITGLLISDARAFDLGSILRDVTASTKRLSFTQQRRRPAPAHLPCPPYVPFSWTTNVGCRTGSDFVPKHLFAKGDASSTGKIIGRTTAFLRLRVAALSIVHKTKKRGPDGSVCRGRVFQPTGHWEGEHSNYIARCRRK